MRRPDGGRTLKTKPKDLEQLLVSEFTILGELDPRAPTKASNKCSLCAHDGYSQMCCSLIVNGSAHKPGTSSAGTAGEKM